MKILGMLPISLMTDVEGTELLDCDGSDTESGVNTLNICDVFLSIVSIIINMNIEKVQYVLIKYLVIS